MKGHCWSCQFDCNVQPQANLCGCLECLFVTIHYMKIVLSLTYVITVVELVRHQWINSVQRITVIISWMDNMACSRNVDLRVGSDNIADLAFQFLTTCRCYTIWKF